MTVGAETKHGQCVPIYHDEKLVLLSLAIFVLKRRQLDDRSVVGLWTETVGVWLCFEGVYII